MDTSTFTDWKKGFDAWEGATAKWFEEILKNPLLLGPAGFFLTAAMRWKAAMDEAKARMWQEAGLPTRRDQERTLHLLYQMQSRILDLEEKLERPSSDRKGA